MSGLTDRQRLAVALIALGALWLLGSLGLFPTGFLVRALAWWPLLLIGLGLDLVMPERAPRGVPFVVLAVLLALVLALPGPWRAPAERERAFAEPVGGAERARIVLELGSPPTELRSLDDPATLFEAVIRDRADVRFEVSGRDRKSIALSRRGRPWRGPAGDASWDLGIGPAVPVDLTVDGGSGGAVLDLSGVRLERLRVDGGSGPVELALPGADAEGPEQDAEVDGGSGPVRLRIAPGARGEWRVDGGSGPVDVTLAEGVRGRLVLEGGSGPIRLDLPDGAPVALDVDDDGSGSLRVAAWLARTEGSGDTGRWRAGADGDPPLRVVVEDAGSGSIEVR